MDYDGANQRPLTHLGSIALSPRFSPDSSRVAFSAMTGGGWNIAMYSLDLGRMVSFPHFGGTNLSPAWSPEGKQIAFSTSRTGDPEIFICDSDGSHLRRVTAYHGPDVAPVWNPLFGCNRPSASASGAPSGVARLARAIGAALISGTKLGR